MQAAPAVGDGGLHSHRHRGFGGAVAFVDKVAVGPVKCGRPADRGLRHRPVAQGEDCADPGPGDGQPAQPGMNDEQHQQEQRHERQIEQRRHRRPRHKPAHRIQIAQRLCIAGASPRAIGQPCPHPGPESHRSDLLIQL